jgi:4-hydroxy-3-polyprenylbenzoate decarboxylase
MEVVLGVSGASGAGLAVRFLSLVAPRPEVDRIHLVVTASALEVARGEIGRGLSSAQDYLAMLPLEAADRGKIVLHSDADLSAPISSGSFPVAGMAVLPCSGGTLAAVANGISRGLLQRAADVSLKERRPLVLGFRESPYSLVHIENMRRATLAGAIVMPPAPPFYISSPTIERLMDAYLGRVARVFGIPLSEEFVWKGPPRGR